MKSKLTKKQEIKMRKTIGNQRIEVTIRHDDRCGNGHNTFSIVGDLYEGRDPEPSRCGQIQDEIKKFFPELEPYFKWHLWNTDTPVHYMNAAYFADDKDCWGKRKGEPYRFECYIKFNDSPFPYKPSKKLLAFIDEVGLDADWGNFELCEVPHPPATYDFKPKWAFVLMNIVKWHEAPFDTQDEAAKFIYGMSKCKVEIVKIATAYGEGKKPDLESARKCANWPEATLEQLRDPKQLKARLPKLRKEFKSAVESLGMVY